MSHSAGVSRPLFDGHRVIDSSGFNEAWSEHHGFLLDVAYRLLGSYSDAEDIVQEAFSRLLRTDLDPIEDVRAWLVVVVSRLCLDQLRSARVRRESYVGPWLPEPVISPPGAEPDPADRITLDDSVRLALLVVLERLSAAERGAFVLHDVFGFSFDDVGEILGRTPEASRQLAARARKRIADETRGGLVTKIHGMGNPQKLAYVASLLGTNAAGAS